MANRQNKVVDGLVNPAAIGGLTVIADQIVIDDGAVVTITFPAYTIFTNICTYSGTAVAKTKAVSSGIGTVTYTATGDGTLDYVIVASTNTTVAAFDSSDGTIAVTPVP